MVSMKINIFICTDKGGHKNMASEFLHPSLKVVTISPQSIYVAGFRATVLWGTPAGLDTMDLQGGTGSLRVTYDKDERSHVTRNTGCLKNKNKN